MVLGRELAELGLYSGADDISSIVIEENVLASRGLEVAPRPLEAVVTALASKVVIVRDPDPTAGNRRSTTVLVGFFHDHHAETLVRDEDRRRHRTCTRTNDDHVVVGLRLNLSRHCCYAIS